MVANVRAVHAFNDPKHLDAASQARERVDGIHVADKFTSRWSRPPYEPR
jgi:hypothetical protein